MFVMAQFFLCVCVLVEHQNHMSLRGTKKEKRVLLMLPFNTVSTVIWIINKSICGPLWSRPQRTGLYVYFSTIRNNMNSVVADAADARMCLPCFRKGAAAHPRGSVLFRCILPLIIQAEPIKPTIITVISPLFILMQFPISEVIMSIFFAGRIFLRWQRRSERNVLLQ